MTAVPEIIQHLRSSNDCFLVLASDGVWGLQDVTNQWVVEIVKDGIERRVDPAMCLMEEVKKLKPGDDVTILVVVFLGKEGQEDENRIVQ
jgi:serine/threonine protein phosphatase PrpC